MSSPVRLRGVMFVGAHPDDETIMAGGVLAMLSSRGVPVTLVCATDGRGGEAGEVPGADTPDALARVRAGELRCAAEALGAARLVQLGYEDPVIGPEAELYPFAADEETLASQIAGLAHDHGVDVLLTHGSDGDYGHPAHQQVHRAVRRAAECHAPGLLVYSAAAQVPGIEDRLWNVSDPAHLALPIDPWAEAKIAAMLCHRTQHPLFKRRRNLQTVAEALRPVEGFFRQWPPVPRGAVPDDPFAALLIEAGAWTPQHSPAE